MATETQDIASRAYIAYVKEKGFPPKNASQLTNFSKFHDPPFVGVKYSMARNVVANPPEIDTNKQDPYQQNGIIEDKNAENTEKSETIENTDNAENNGDVVNQPPPPPPPQVEQQEEVKQEPEIPTKEEQQEIVQQEPKESKKVETNPYLDSSVTNKFVTEVDHEKFVKKHDVVPTKSKVATAFDLFKEKTGSKPKNTIQFLAFVEKNNLNLTYSECSQYIQYIKKYQDSDDEDDDNDGDQGAGYSNYDV